MKPSLAPSAAWQPLPSSEWDADHARHLLRRAGWTARPEEVEAAVRDGLAATLARLFPEKPPVFEKPRVVARFEQGAGPNAMMAVGLQKMSSEERLRAIREMTERARIGSQELAVKWLGFAARPDAAAWAKWVLFLSDVYVISADKVRNPGVIHQHYETLAKHGLGSAPELTKAVSRSPAMVIYLDLNQSQLRAPNENFARELFELFVLGEGNYTENDIKEAARAFTGYRARADGTFRYEPRQHDGGTKTIFGGTGNFTGDDVIELAYSQPAAGVFLPKEMSRFYLSDEPLPAEHLAALGELWRGSGFDLRTLVLRFFGSRLFFAPEFRGNQIKSPIQFFLGIVQDLQLDVAPIPRLSTLPLRQMGQALFQPPNVRGWVGGRQWINSSTLTARRQLVEMLFAPIDERLLNADEQIELVAARTNGAARFTAADELFAPLAPLAPAEASARLVDRFLPGSGAAGVRDSLARFLATGAPDSLRLPRVRRAALTLMQAPEYQLC